MSDVIVKGLIEIRKTNNATFFRDKKGDEFWIPKSLLNYVLRTPNVVIIKVPEWFAEKEKIDYE